MYQALGAQLLIILGQRAAKVEAYRRGHGLTMPLLIDVDRAVTKRYGVYHRLGLTAFNIARPGTFIIDREGRIRFIYVGSGQRDRPAHATLLAELENLRS
jgi:peroxiredoxin